MRIPLKYDKQLKDLRKFRSAIQSFARLDVKPEVLLPNSDVKIKLETRKQINNLIPSVSQYIQKANIQASAYHFPSKSEVDFFSNLFRIKSFGISYENIVDVIDRAIGHYDEKRRKFIHCLLNPICWVREFIRIPFHIITFAGYDSKKVELSLIGKIYKLIAGLLAFVASLTTILDLFGINVKQFIKAYLLK